MVTGEADVAGVVEPEESWERKESRRAGVGGGGNAHSFMLMDGSSDSERLRDGLLGARGGVFSVFYQGRGRKSLGVCLIHV